MMVEGQKGNIIFIIFSKGHRFVAGMINIRFEISRKAPIAHKALC
jgi:hypothetical protein